MSRFNWQKWWAYHPFRMLWQQIAIQALMLGSLPFISRMYSAQTLSNWGILQSSALLLWSFSQLKSDQAIVKAATKAQRIALFQIGLTLHLLWSTCLVCILFCSGNTIRAGAQSATGLWLYLTGMGANGMALAFLLAMSDFQRIMQQRLWTALLAFPGSILLFYLLPEKGLETALTIGVWIPFLYLVYQERSQKWVRINRNEWSKARQKFQGFGAWLSLGAVFGAFSEHIFVMAVAWYYNPILAGGFYLSLRLCSMPVSLMNATYGQFNYRHFQDLYMAGNFDYRAPLLHWKNWLGPGLLYYGALMWLGPSFFPLLFGDKWAVAGPLLGILAVRGFFQFLSSPTSSSFLVLSLPKYPFFSSLLMAIFTLFCLWELHGGVPLPEVITHFTGFTILNLMAYNALMLWSIKQN